MVAPGASDEPQRRATPAESVVRWPDGRVRVGLEPSVERAVRWTASLVTRIQWLTMRDDDLSISELCRRAGISRQTFSELMDGARWPDLLTIFAIQEALSVWLMLPPLEPVDPTETRDLDLWLWGRDGPTRLG